MLATGALERPLVFSNNDRPGVMLASAVRTYLNRFAVAPQKRAVIVTNNDTAYRDGLRSGRRRALPSPLPTIASAIPSDLLSRAAMLGMAMFPGNRRCRCGRGKVGERACRLAGAHAASIECDVLAMSGGWIAGRAS